MHFRVTGEWNGEPFNRVIEAENINDCYDHWMMGADSTCRRNQYSN